MQKLISLYTLFYIVLIFCSSLLQIVPGVSALREGYILFLFMACFIYLRSLKFSKLTVLVLIYVLCNGVSFYISPNKTDSLSSFILYVSGPVIFLLLATLPLKKSVIDSLKRRMTILFVAFIMVALIIFPFQTQFYTLFGLDKGTNFINLYRIGSDGSFKPRLSGLCVHPTTMGALSLFVCLESFIKHKNKKSLLPLIPYYLSNTRSILFGLPFAYYSSLSLRKKIAIMFPILVLFGVGIFILTHSVMDSSALVHFTDLLERGPKLLLAHVNLLGNGHGTMSPFTRKSRFIHVESDLYIALMQIGIIGVFVYLILIWSVFRTVKKDKTEQGKYCIYVLLCINLGCLVLSYYVVRFLSNYMWIELGLYFSYRRHICSK